MGLPHYAQGSRLIARGFFIMMNKMVVSNLVHRPIRSVISIVAIALEVTLILLIVGLCYGLMNDSKNRSAGIGFDVIVQPPGSSFLAGISGAPVSIKVADMLQKMPHVKVVSPIIWIINRSGGLEVTTTSAFRRFYASTARQRNNSLDKSAKFGAGFDCGR